MNKFILQTMLLSTLSLFGAPSNAEQGWVTPVKVVRIVATIQGGINVRLSPELSGCTSLSGYGGTYASLHPDHLGKDKITSILLAAYMADKPIAIYLMDSTCKIGEVELGGR